MQRRPTSLRDGEPRAASADDESYRCLLADVPGCTVYGGLAHAEHVVSGSGRALTSAHRRYPVARVPGRSGQGPHVVALQIVGGDDLQCDLFANE